MNLPSSAVSYKDSVISKFPLILRVVSHKTDGITPVELYNSVKDDLRDIAEFTEALDVCMRWG